MKYLASFLLILLLVGCSTVVPVTRKFPDAPSHLFVKCPQLKLVDDSAKLSDIAKTITENYTLYYECAVKSDIWIEWYQTQKTIFESVNK
jgi:hypothetical protein